MNDRHPAEGNLIRLQNSAYGRLGPYQILQALPGYRQKKSQGGFLNPKGDDVDNEISKNCLRHLFCGKG
jgi:hypothetical protein